MPPIPDDAEVHKIASLHGAFGDPSRLKILLALSRGELCVCDVSHVVGLSISATLHQLRLLRNLDLVRETDTEKIRNEKMIEYFE